MLTSKREQTRASFPVIANAIDLFRETFPGAKVIYAQENGRSVGTKLERGIVPYLEKGNQ